MGDIMEAIMDMELPMQHMELQDMEDIMDMEDMVVWPIMERASLIMAVILAMVITMVKCLLIERIRCLLYKKQKIK